MADTKYILRYLPLFYEDLEEKVAYIVETLKNPQAAIIGQQGHKYELGEYKAKTFKEAVG